MVEFALMAPLLFLLLFGIVDFGRAIFFANEITNAAREGARVAILASNPCNTVIGNPSSNCTTSNGAGVDVCTAVKQEANLIPGANWTCGENTAAVPPCTVGCAANANLAYVEVDSLTTCTTASSPSTRTTPRLAGNKAVKVTIVYYFRPLTGMIGVFFPSNYFLTSTTCARQEW
ncbi:MAG: TadE/TadG family type IV pilus assembly protein [Candidatus Dormibacteria bacterium]